MIRKLLDRGTSGASPPWWRPSRRRSHCGDARCAVESLRPLMPAPLPRQLCFERRLLRRLLPSIVIPQLIVRGVLKREVPRYVVGRAVNQRRSPEPLAAPDCRAALRRFCSLRFCGQPPVKDVPRAGHGVLVRHGRPAERVPILTPSRGVLSPYRPPSCLENAQIKRVAAAHPGFSAAQVVLVWLWGQGLVTHPRTESAAHMRENLNAAGTLTLTAAEMATISRGLAVPDCSSGPQKGTTCPTAVAKPARGCCKICPLTTTIP